MTDQIPAGIRFVAGPAGSYAEYWRDPETGCLMMLHSEEADAGFVEWAFIGEGIDSDDPTYRAECQSVVRIAQELGATFVDQPS